MYATDAPSEPVQRTDLPYGMNDLVSPKQILRIDDDKVCCYVRGCHEQLRIHRQGAPGDVCVDHGIRCYLSTAGATYEYIDPTRNLIAGQSEFATKVRRNEFKYECHRFGLERSEDALTWNFFISLRDSGLLKWIGFELTGILSEQEPLLFLWGLQASPATWQPWDLLIAARQRFESMLPVERPLTEPDAALYLPGKYLALIEVKFCSSNPWYKTGPRQNAMALTLDELRCIYWDHQLQSIQREAAASAKAIPYQLWRNMIFSEWMSKTAGDGSEPFLVNLVRSKMERRSNAAFGSLVNKNKAYRLTRAHWEDFTSSPYLKTTIQHCSEYLSRKTAGLRPALREK